MVFIWEGYREFLEQNLTITDPYFILYLTDSYGSFLNSNVDYVRTD